MSRRRDHEFKERRTLHGADRNGVAKVNRAGCFRPDELVLKAGFREHQDLRTLLDIELPQKAFEKARSVRIESEFYFSSLDVLAEVGDDVGSGRGRACRIAGGRIGGSATAERADQNGYDWKSHHRHDQAWP